MPRAKSVKRVRKPKRPVGKPPIKITAAVCKRAERLAAQGLTKEQIASVLRMGKSTLYEKAKEYPDFADAIEAGRDKGIKEVTNALFQKAKKGDVPAVKVYLFNRDRTNWKDRTENTHQGPNGDSIQVEVVRRVIVKP